MKKLTHVLVLGALILVSPVCRADRETVAHSFKDNNPAVTYTNKDKTATAGGVVYTCTGTTAKFAAVGGYPNLTLPGENDMMTTTKVNELRQLDVSCSQSGTPSNIKIYLSKDSVDFGSALSGEGVDYTSSGFIRAVFPRGNYYVRIVNEAKSNSFSIRSITYYLDHCNCFEYIP